MRLWLTLLLRGNKKIKRVKNIVYNNNRKMKNDRDMDKYLRPTEIIDWKHPKVLEIAYSLSAGAQDLEERGKTLFPLGQG